MSRDTTVYTARPELLTMREILELIKSRALEMEWHPTYKDQPEMPKGIFDVGGGGSSQDQIRISCEKVPDFEREELLDVFAAALTEEQRGAILEAKTSYTASTSWSPDPTRDRSYLNLVYLLAEAYEGLIYDQQENRFYSASEYRAKHATSLGPEPPVI